MKYHLLDFRLPTHFVPRIIAQPNPSAVSCSFVKLEHVLAIMSVEEQLGDTPFRNMNRPIAPLVSLPLFAHVRQKPLSMATVASKVINENLVLGVSLGHGLNYEINKRKSVMSVKESQPCGVLYSTEPFTGDRLVEADGKLRIAAETESGVVSQLPSFRRREPRRRAASCSVSSNRCRALAILKGPNTKECKFEDVVKSAMKPLCWCWFNDLSAGSSPR